MPSGAQVLAETWLGPPPAPSALAEWHGRVTGRDAGPCSDLEIQSWKGFESCQMKVQSSAGVHTLVCFVSK